MQRKQSANKKNTGEQRKKLKSTLMVSRRVLGSRTVETGKKLKPTSVNDIPTSASDVEESIN